VGPAALALAVLSLAALWLPVAGMYLALGLAIVAVASGWLGYRRRREPGARRLMAAGGLTVGALGGLLAAAKIVLTLLAIDAMGDLL
jgi:hypothetical protein